jgi:hypothetical protein
MQYFKPKSAILTEKWGQLEDATSGMRKTYKFKKKCGKFR